jgi:hypothetical protein
MRTAMADRSAPRAVDRRSAAAHRDEQLHYLGARYGLTREQAEDLIEQHGNRRARLDCAARRLED